ncbi:phospholipase D family protein [Spirillospora sp. CA-142024]|uniref:phospholipase D family protein n=1 Tax=Spirillospora sp. CA-142024 TaxID=3240036 RepID=UPI003D8C852C
MADIEALKKKYFVQPDDTDPPSEPLPATFSGCRVTPLIDGKAYFADLAAKIATLGLGTPSENSGQFIYITGWWVGFMGHPAPPGRPPAGSELPFSLDGDGAPNLLIDLLKAKARAGVDVRVMGWISFSGMADYGILTTSVRKRIGIAEINLSTMASIRALRTEPALADKACLNIIAHSAGASHTKMVLVGDGGGAVGYTGGLDLVNDRHGNPPHPAGQWHDVQAKVEGPAVLAMYDFYRSIWNELRAREVKTFRDGNVKVASHTAAMPYLPTRSLPTTPVGKHHVQSLRTVPRFNYKSTNNLPENKEISFAPDGLFEVRSAWFNAVLTAERYVYIEDQGFWSVDVMAWLNGVLKIRDDLKVILVKGINDPNDPPFPAYANVALWNGLLHDLNAQQRSRVHAFLRNVFVHTKSTIVDDHWAIIGSANAYQRSLYSDIEHAVGVLDEDDMLVQQYRTRLWSDIFGLLPADQQKIADIDKALNVWDSTWGTPGSGVSLPPPPTLAAIPLPTRETKLDDDQQDRHDRYDDVDSRQPWGGCTP